jgi:hypothetical protein
MHFATWNGANEGGTIVPSGTYFARLVVDGHVFTKQMLLLK